MALDNDDLLDCFVNLPAQQGAVFQIDYATIALNQQQDQDLLQHAQQEPNKVVQMLLNHEVEVYCYIPQPNAPWKIYLPYSMLQNMVHWYHYALGHVGISCLWDTQRMHCMFSMQFVCTLQSCSLWAW